MTSLATFDDMIDVARRDFERAARHVRRREIQQAGDRLSRLKSRVDELHDELTSVKGDQNLAKAATELRSLHGDMERLEGDVEQAESEDRRAGNNRSWKVVVSVVSVILDVLAAILGLAVIVSALKSAAEMILTRE